MTPTTETDYAALYRTTAEIWERITAGEKLKLEGRERYGIDWCKVIDAKYWDFLRIAPTEPTPEQLRQQANAEKIAELKATWEKPVKDGGGFKVQWSDGHAWFDVAAWHPFAPPRWDLFVKDGNEVRRKPEPTYQPWTLETCPLDVWVAPKGSKSKFRVNGISEEGVYIGNFFVKFERLLRDYETAEGKPCGRVAE